MTRKLRCGINIDPKNPRGRPSGEELKELGADWVRFTFKDDSTGSTPSQFAFYDQVVEHFAQANIGILMILSYETLHGRPDRHASDAAWDAYIQKFATRCRQIAEHYGRAVRSYQIWNEPDYLDPKPGYDPTIEPQVFGRMLKACFDAIKSAGSATVVAGGLAAGQPGWLDGVRNASPDRRIYADAVGVHPYGRRPEPNWPRSDWGFGRLDQLIEAYHQSARLPIWITEVGTNDNQPEFPERAFRVLDLGLAEKAPVVFWFCWSDGMVGQFGLVDDIGQPKLSYSSFRRFASQPGPGEPGVQPLPEQASIQNLLDRPDSGAELRMAVLNASGQQTLVHLNAKAALQRRMFAEGFFPSTNEFDVEVDGIQYRGQRADNPHTGQARVYFAKVGDWDNVDFRGRKAGRRRAIRAPRSADVEFVEHRSADVAGLHTRKISDWASQFSISVKGLGERPDSPEGDVVYVVKDIFTTRDGSWEPSPEIPGSLPAWAREQYLKPWGAADYFDDAGADHHLFALVLGLDGMPMPEKGIMYWSDGFDKLGDPSYRQYAMQSTKPASGWANIPLAGGSNYNPAAGPGPWCWCPVGASEVVIGGGMPHKWHVSFFAVWQAVRREDLGGPIDNPPPVDAEPETIRQAAWLRLGVVYAPTGRFTQYAREHDLGAPLTDEFEVGGLRLQGFARGIVYTRGAESGNLAHLAW